MTLPEHVGAHETLRQARDLLLRLRMEHHEAVAAWAPPQPEHLNWALDWFDVVAAQPGTAERTALWVVEEDGTHTKVSYAEMSLRSGQLAAWLRAEGVDRGDRLLLMLGNQVELWETLLACIKLGVVVIPASTLLSTADLVDRVHRGHVAHVVARSVDTPTCPGRGRGSRSATTSRAGCRTARASSTSRRSSPRSPPGPTSRCCSTSPRARPHSPSWWSTPRCPIR
jgi:acetyl-CoA synthetase